MVFFYGTVSYLTFSTDDFLSTTDNETKFTELRRSFEDSFEIKAQEGYILKYLLEFSSLLLVSVLIRLIKSCD